MRARSFAFVVLKVCVACAALTYVLLQAPLAAVGAALASAQPEYMIAAAAASIAAQLLAGYRLKLLTSEQGIPLSTARVFEINLVTTFYGIFLPGGNMAGGAIRFFRLSGAERKMAEAFTALVFDRVFATLALCATGLFFWLFQGPAAPAYLALSMALAFAALFAPYILILRARMPKLRGRHADWTTRVLVRSKAQNLLGSLERHRGLSGRSIVKIAGLAVASQLLGAFIFYLLALSLRLDSSFLTIAWIRSAVVLVTMIPVSVSGLGIRESAFFHLLRPYGVLGERAIAMSFLVFSVTVLLVGLLGGVLEGKRFFFPEASGLWAKR